MSNIALFFVALSLMLGLSFAANCPVSSGWCSVGYYYNWYNVSNVVWTYQNAFGAPQPVNWALMKFNTSSLGNLGQINIQGYSSSFQNLGTVPYISITGSAGTTIIEPYRYTISGTPWNTISIFFNPTSTDIQGVGQIIQNVSCLYSGSCVLDFRNQILNIWNPSDKVTCNAAQICTLNQGTLNLPPYIYTANDIYLQVNFTTKAPLVVLTNRSMIGNYFNITYQTGFFNYYQVNTTPTQYRLYSGSSYVQNGIVASSATNQIFGNPNGFEGYFAINPNYSITEGMSLKTCIVFAVCLYNSISAPFTQTSTYSTQGYLSLKAQTTLPTQYYIIPAFTTNYFINNGNYVTNPTPIVNQSINSSLQGWYYDFLNRSLVVIKSWQFAYNNLAYNSYASGIPNTITYNSAGYALINITHFKNYGASCQNIYLRAFVNGSDPYTPAAFNEDYGAVKFYPIGCNLTSPTFELLISNKTVNGDTFDSFYIYSDSQSNFTSKEAISFASYPTYSSWDFANGNSIGLCVDSATCGAIGDNATLGFVVQLNAPMQAGSAAGFYNGGTPEDIVALSGNRYKTTAGVSTPNLTKTFLVSAKPIYSGSSVFMSTPYLMLTYDSGLADDWNESNQGLAVVGGYQYFKFTANNGITAMIERPYTTNGVFIKTQHRPNAQSGCYTYCLPSLPVGNFGNTSTSKTGLNYTTNMTTIPFNSNSVNAKTVLLTTGVSIPVWWFYIAEIILMIIAAGMFEATKDGQILFAIMTSGSWLIVLFALNWTLLIVAVLITIVFALYEFTPHEKTTRVKNR